MKGLTWGDRIVLVGSAATGVILSATVVLSVVYQKPFPKIGYVSAACLMAQGLYIGQKNC